MKQHTWIRVESKLAEDLRTLSKMRACSVSKVIKDRLFEIPGNEELRDNITWLKDLMHVYLLRYSQLTSCSPDHKKVIDTAIAAADHEWPGIDESVPF